MRTTLALDDDVLQAIKERARREHRTAGAVLSDLARLALTQGLGTTGSALEPFYGFEPFPARGPIVTNELIDQLRDDESM